MTDAIAAHGAPTNDVPTGSLREESGQSPSLAAIATYPVKSLGGGLLDTAAVQPWGLADDRRWMVINPAGHFLTQRDHPAMALVHARVTADGLILSAPSRPPVTVHTAALGAPCTVRIWRDIVQARDCGDDASAWLSGAIGAPCRLVHLADTGARRLRPDYANNHAEAVSFADGFPVLLTAQSSLDDLNARLAAPIPMARFRPNLTIAGAPPWAEDSWRRIRIGGAIFRVAKACDRCIITTIDPATGLQPDPGEPLRTLATFRRDTRGSIMFGQNLVPEQTGELRIGDAVHVLETGPTNVLSRP